MKVSRRRRRRRIHFCGENHGHITIDINLGDGAFLRVEDHINERKAKQKILDRLRSVIDRAEKLLQKS